MLLTTVNLDLWVARVRARLRGAWVSVSDLADVAVAGTNSDSDSGSDAQADTDSDSEEAVDGLADGRQQGSYNGG